MRKAFRILAVLAAALLTGVIGFRIYTVNKEYPAAQVNRYSLQEKFDFYRAEISVDSVELCRTSDVIENYISDVLDENQNPLTNDQCKVLIVTITAENKTDEELKLPFHKVAAESDGWHNGLGLASFQALNSSLSWPEIKLSPGEKTALKLAFNMYDIQFKKGNALFPL